MGKKIGFSSPPATRLVRAILNKVINPKTVNEIVERYAKKIGLDFKLTPHGARATFIGELLDAGVDIYSVSREVKSLKREDHPRVRQT